MTVLPPPPAITSSLTATGVIGQSFQYQILATNSPTSYGCGTLPTGLNLSSTSGVISGTPTVAGVYDVNISATNAAGTGNAILVITLATPPVITAPFTSLASFTSTNGSYPYGGVIQGSDGNFYGTTYSGGSSGYGTVFKMTPGGSITTLCSFAGTNGSYPYGGVIQGSDGNFYGATYSGGSSGYGVVFKATPSGSLTALCSFSSSNGANPYESVVQGSDGNFYRNHTQRRKQQPRGGCLK